MTKLELQRLARLRAYLARERSQPVRIPGWAFVLGGALLGLALGYCAAVWLRLL
jgi:hypothetical protein